MKRTHNLTENLLKQFDKELRAIVMYDLKQFKLSKANIFGSNSGNNQDKDLLVAWSIYIFSSTYEKKSLANSRALFVF